jgi:hypothetical protein
MASERKPDGARLPREASPAEVAKDGEHNNDDDDDPKPGRHMILSLGACRLYGDPTLVFNSRGLRRERNGSRSRERAGEPREDAEVGVKRDPRLPRRDALLGGAHRQTQPGRAGAA